MSYLIFVIAVILFGCVLQAVAQLVQRMYGKRDAGLSTTGAALARRMLDDAGLQDIAITYLPGSERAGRFDQSARAIALGQGAYYGTDIAAAAAACHECGHALQMRDGLLRALWLRVLRAACSVCSASWLVVAVTGFLTGFMPLQIAGVALLTIAFVSQLALLPVELQASKHALAYLACIAAPECTSGARKVLISSAFTYLASSMNGIVPVIVAVKRLFSD